MPDILKVKADYIKGKGSLTDLSKKYNMPRSTLQKICAKQGWVALRMQHGAKVDAKLVETASDQTVEQAIKISKAADLLLERLNEIATGPLTTKGLQELASALKTLKDVKGLKSDIDIKEQEARINKLKKDAESDASGSKVIEVIFNSDDGDDINEYTV